MSVLYWGAQNKDQVLQMGLVSAEQRGRTTSFDMLAILLLMQPKMALPFFCCKGTYQVLLCQAAFQPSSLQPVLVCGFFPPQGQDFACCFELHEVPVGLLPQPVEVPLNSSTPVWSVSHSSRFRIICRLAEGVFSPIIHVIIKDTEQLSVDSWGTPLVTPLQLDCVIDHNPSSLAFWTVFSPFHFTLILPCMLSVFIRGCYGRQHPLLSHHPVKQSFHCGRLSGWSGMISSTPLF